MAKRKNPKNPTNSPKKSTSTSTASPKSSEKSSASKEAIAKIAAKQSITKIAAKLYKPIINNEGYISLEMSPLELLQLVTLLKFSKDSFTKIASTALNTNDDILFDAYAAKAQSAEALHSKFGSLAQIGEPFDRSVH